MGPRPAWTLGKRDENVLFMSVIVLYRNNTQSSLYVAALARRKSGTATFDTALYLISKGYVEIKCQLDATEVFIADLIACSTCFGHHYAQHQELKSIMQWVLPVVFRAVVFKLLVWCGAEGYVPGLDFISTY